MNVLKDWCLRILDQDSETDRLLSFLRSIREKRGPDCNIVDVACGYGRTLKRLQEAGFDAIGVEINSDIVSINKAAGLNCVEPEEFEANKGSYDIVVMSHIIEHFEPAELMDFMDFYLDRLKDGGYLVVATPLLSSYFYEDFDHVKPYSPAGLLMVFGAESAQVQYRSRNKLVLEDIWFRRSYYRIFFAKGRYMKSSMSRFIQVAHLFSVVVYLISCRMIGKKDGWIGVFRKLD